MVKLFGKAVLAAATLSLAAGPAVAQGAAASRLSLRASTASEKESDIAGAPIIAIIGLVAIVGGGIFIAVDDDNPDSP